MAIAANAGFTAASSPSSCSSASFSTPTEGIASLKLAASSSMSNSKPVSNGVQKAPTAAATTGSGTKRPPAMLLRKCSSDSVMEDKTNAMSSHQQDRVTATSSDQPPPSRQRKYERKTKRFIWPEDLHRLFVAAIFDVGLKNASPKALLALMGSAGPTAGLTTEHLKSHLQKYRLNYERSRQEFLTYYDQSARRNMKRRRKNPKSEHNTMFVFPICPQSKRGGMESDSDAESMDEEAPMVRVPSNQDMAVRNSASPSPHEHVHSSQMAAGLSRRKSFQESPHHALHAAQLDQPQLNERTLHAHHQQGQFRQRQVATGPRQQFRDDLPSASRAYEAPNVSMFGTEQPMQFGSSFAPPKQAPIDVAMANNVRQASNNARFSTSEPPSSAPTAHNSMSMAAGSVTPNELQYDPQWSILSTLMSPHITGMSGAASAPDATAQAGLSDGFSLNEEPTHLQLQMHMAMQAQMNLHRQMLMRKVEVSQHIINNSRDGSQSSRSTSDASFLQQWNNAASQGHLPMPATQNMFVQSNQRIDPSATHFPNGGNQPPAPEQLRRSNSVRSETSNPPEALPTNNAVGNPMAASVPRERPSLPSSSMASFGSQVPSNAETASSVTSGLAPCSTAPSSSVPPPPPAHAPTEEDPPLDLYRWDRIDLNMELEDDDLFGFLKS